jgi:hypothetical protein
VLLTHVWILTWQKLKSSVVFDPLLFPVGIVKIEFAEAMLSHVQQASNGQVAVSERLHFQSLQPRQKLKKLRI